MTAFVTAFVEGGVVLSVRPSHWLGRSFLGEKKNVPQFAVASKTTVVLEWFDGTVRVVANAISLLC